jgi:RNA-binding protein PNO1
MSAPTARLDKQAAVVVTAPQPEDEDDVLLIDAAGSLADEAAPQQDEQIDSGDKDVVMDEEGRPKFSSVANNNQKIKKEMRSIPVPPHRFSPLKTCWTKIYPPLVEHLKLQVKMDVRHKKVLIRTCKETTDPGAIQKGADFLKAFTLGFDVDDAIALLRLDDLYIETFEVKDVKTLTGDHLSRAIGRIAGKDGKTKFAIENASRTRVVLADSKIHILGGFSNIKIARETIVSLILGAPPGKVYGNLRVIASRLKERY